MISKVFLGYFKENKNNIIIYWVSDIIFCLMCWLYGQHMESVFYATILSLFLFLIVHILSFSKYYKKWKLLKQLSYDIEYNWKDIKDTNSEIEKCYQEIIRFLGKKCTNISLEFESRQQESLEYYTTWVHQIKTPISVMQMILKSEDTEEHRALSAELFRIEQYVEMVLSYIRLGSESSDFIFKEYNVDKLIRQVIRKYASQFIRRKIKLVYETVDKNIVTDEKWFCFILEQIISNSIKYTYEGSVTIYLEDDKYISIRDTGIGIAAEDLPRIFEKGFTGYNGRADKKATGLGLYLCRQAADKLGIKLSASSVPAKGSTFRIDLTQYQVNEYNSVK